MTIETMPMVWGMAFATNIFCGSVIFYLLFNDIVRPTFTGVSWWFGWWSFVDATAIALNVILGSDNFWSYHQTGIVIDTAINVGILWFICKGAYQNWGMTPADWDKFEKIVKEARIRNLQK